MSNFFSDYYAEDAYYTFIEYLNDPTQPIFNLDDFPGIHYDFEEYVQLEKIGEDEKIYLTTEEVVEILNAFFDGYAGIFNYDENGIYEIIITHKYKVIDWTDEMKEWIATHKDKLEIDDEE